LIPLLLEHAVVTCCPAGQVAQPEHGVFHAAATSTLKVPDAQVEQLPGEEPPQPVR
jgi:hypothetical protein